MAATDFVIRHVVIRGAVQGVGYRAWAEHTARTLGLQGWVRNRRDDTVEAVFAGPGEKVTAMLAACRQGPAAATVTAVDQHDADMAALDQRRPGEAFSVLRTM
jgi:acylphosphatase